MEAPDWLMLRCGACREELKIPRGLAVVYVRCPGCGEVVGVPGGVLDPARRYHVFETEVAELPEVAAGGGSGGVEAIVAKVEVPVRRFGTPVGGGGRAEGGFGSGAAPEPEAKPAPGAMKGLRKTEEFAKTGETTSGHYHGHRGRRRGHEAPVWDSASDRGRASSDRLAKRFVQVAVGGIVVLGVGLGWMLWTDAGRAPQGTGEAGAGEGAAELVAVDLGGDEGSGDPATGTDEVTGGEAGGDFEELVAGVEAFYGSENLAELKRTVRDVERVGPLMDAFYAERGFRKMLMRSVAETALPVEVDGLWRVPVLMADRTEREVVVEEVGGKYLVDWESYVGYSAMPWTELLVKMPREEVTMRVWAKADNYYNYDFADEVSLGCWGLSDPERQVRIYGYAPRGSELAKTLERVLGGEEKALMVTFRYPEVARESRQVVLTGLIAEGWVGR